MEIHRLSDSLPDFGKVKDTLKTGGAHAFKATKYVGGLLVKGAHGASSIYRSVKSGANDIKEAFKEGYNEGVEKEVKAEKSAGSQKPGFFERHKTTKKVVDKTDDFLSDAGHVLGKGLDYAKKPFSYLNEKVVQPTKEEIKSGYENLDKASSKHLNSKDANEIKEFQDEQKAKNPNAHQPPNKPLPPTPDRT